MIVNAPKTRLLFLSASLPQVNLSLSTISSNAVALESSVRDIEFALNSSLVVVSSLSSNLTVLSNATAALSGNMSALFPLLSILGANLTSFMSPTRGIPTVYGRLNVYAFYFR